MILEVTFLHCQFPHVLPLGVAINLAPLRGLEEEAAQVRGDLEAQKVGSRDLQGCLHGSYSRCSPSDICWLVYEPCIYIYIII